LMVSSQAGKFVPRMCDSGRRRRGARMLEGRRAKARRGELGKPVPMGYVRRPSGEVALDPDEQAPGGGRAPGGVHRVPAPRCSRA
jgi:hypothetical protein